jgi:hypothetical protein
VLGGITALEASSRVEMLGALRKLYKIKWKEEEVGWV